MTYLFKTDNHAAVTVTKNAPKLYVMLSLSTKTKTETWTEIGTALVSTDILTRHNIIYNLEWFETEITVANLGLWIHH